MNIHTAPYTRPAKGTVTARVWEIADELTKQSGKRARRQAVIEKFVAEGGNANTASTQYYYWSQAAQNGVLTARSGKDAKSGKNSMQLHIDKNGRVAIPAELRNQMQLSDGGKVTATLVEGELRLISPRTALHRLKSMARRLAPDGEAVVDEFLKEKREEAARD